MFKNFKNFKHKIIYLSIGLLVGSLFPIQSLFAEQPITLIINGKTITNASPQIVSDRTYVPLRVISEELNAKVDWDGVNRVISITSRQQGSVATPPVNTVGDMPIITPEKDNPKPPVDNLNSTNNSQVIKNPITNKIEVNKLESEKTQEDKNLEEFLNAQPPQIPDKR